MSHEKHTLPTEAEGDEEIQSLVQQGSQCPDFPDEHLLSLLEHLPLSVVIYRLEGDTPNDLRFVYINVQALRDSNGILRDAVGQRLEDAVPGILDNSQPGDFFHGALALAKETAPAPRIYEYLSHITPGRWYEIHATQLAPGFVAAVYEDITARKEAQASLRESEERFRSTFAHAAVGLAHVDLKGRFLRVNHKCRETLGYTEEELLSITFQDITHPKDINRGNQALRQLLHGEVTSCSFEKRYIRKDGSVLWAQLTTSPVYNEDNTIKCLISAIEDIGERKRIEETLNHHMKELARSNRDLNEFANLAAHGLQHPMEAIEAELGTLTTQLKGHESADKLRKLQRQVLGLSQRLHGLQRFAQVGRRLHPLDEFDVAAVIDDLVVLLAIPEQFAIKTRPPMPTFKTHTAPLEQTLQHILHNAVHHHDKAQGSIEISVKKRDAFYEFCVQDDGPGIAPEAHERIFNMYEQLAPNEDSKHAGVGLAIVKQCVEQQGGRVWVESTKERGAAFFFEWPIDTNTTGD